MADPLDTVINSTLTRSLKNLIMASAKANALQAWMMANNRTVTEPGGWEITNPLITGRNPNVTSYSYYNALPIAQTDEFDTVRYGWSRIAGSLIISEQEIDENKGPSQVFKLLTAKMTVLQESMKEKMSEYLYGSGTGDDPNGLANLIPDDPTTGSLGGLDRAANTQWRTSSYDFGGNLDETNIEEAFDDIIEIDLSRKNNKISVIIAGRNIFRYYRAAVRDKFMISLSAADAGQASNRMFDLGFSGISHAGVPIVYDEDCPVEKAYFINDEYMKMHYLKGVKMQTKQLDAPWTIDARGRRVVSQFQVCLWRAHRTHAVLINT